MRATGPSVNVRNDSTNPHAFVAYPLNQARILAWLPDLAVFGQDVASASLSGTAA